MDSDINEIFSSLESNDPNKVEDTKKQFHNWFNSVKEPWLIHGMFDMYMSTSSIRIVEIFVGVREPHEHFLFDKLGESLKSSQKLQALTLLGNIVTRNPTWMYKIGKHPLLKELFRMLKIETEIIPMMSALLIVIILLPVIAGLISPSHLQDFFEIFSRLAAWNTSNPSRIPEGQLLHLQLGLYALFNRLYGMYPNSFILYLKHQYTNSENINIFKHTILPMLDTVKIHPLLVTASKEKEVTPARWKAMEANDVVIECAKLTIDNGEKCKEEFRARTASFKSRSSIEYSGSVFDGKYCGRNMSLLDGEDTWSPTVFCSTNSPPGSAPTSIPHTPIAQLVPYTLASSNLPQHEGTSPPEAAVEATPESTPVKDLRVQSSRDRPLSSTVACNLTGTLLEGSQPSSPMRKESNIFRYPSSPLPDARVNAYAVAKVNRLCHERTQDFRGSPHRMLHLDKLGEQLLNMSDNCEQEDKEVEATLNNEIISSTPSHCDDWASDCRNVRGSCRDGGLHMPDSRSVQQFTYRLRYYSNCLPDRNTNILAGMSSGSSPGEGGKFSELQVRRAISWPEIKKATTVSTDASCFALDNTVEEEEIQSSNGPSNQGESFLKEKMVDSMVQTEELPTFGYEYLFLFVLPPSDLPSVHSAPPDISSAPVFPSETKFSPHTALENYIETASKSSREAMDIKTCKEHITLLMLQLQFERHRREVHAERNRRLLGKLRINSTLEEHNNALKDQVALLQKDKENLRCELDRFKQDAKFSLDKIQQTVSYWQEKSTILEKEKKEHLAKINLLNEDVKKQKTQCDLVSKEKCESLALVFELENCVRSTSIAASSTKGLIEELSTLKQRLICAGETESKLQSIIRKVLLNSKKAEESLIATNTANLYAHDLQRSLDAKIGALETAKARLVDLEMQLEKKDSVIWEQKLLLQSVKEQNARQLQEVERKCDELRRVNLLQEEAQLKLLQQEGELRQQMESLELTGRKIQSQHSPPLSASLSSSGTLSLSGGDPTPVKNLQLLVDPSDPQPPSPSPAKDQPSSSSPS